MQNQLAARTETAKLHMNPVLKPGIIYSADNGELICLHCAGMTAKFTGRDRSGMKVTPMTQANADEWKQYFGTQRACESGCTKFGESREITPLQLA